jgi:hypothetical protein
LSRGFWFRFGNSGKAQRNWIPAIGRDSKSAALQTKAAAPGEGFLKAFSVWVNFAITAIPTAGMQTPGNVVE